MNFEELEKLVKEIEQVIEKDKIGFYDNQTGAWNRITSAKIDEDGDIILSYY